MSTAPVNDQGPERPPTSNESTPPPGEHPRSSRTGWWVLGTSLFLALLFGAALASGIIPRLTHARSLEHAAAAQTNAAPRVTVAAVTRRTATGGVVLPGNAVPLLEASLFARVTGYVQKRLVDYGDEVKAKQLLALISAPDVDDQLTEARATLQQARAALQQNEANAVLARSILARSKVIRTSGGGVISPEEIEQQRASVGTTEAGVETAKALIRVQEALVQRYTDLQSFEQIVAPFDGVITARHVEEGDLTTADSTTRELFHLMRTDVLRILVAVPQVYSLGVKTGVPAVVYRAFDPEQQFEGTITRTTNALDPNTRTLLTEVQVPNPDRKLRPGMYLQVRFEFSPDIMPAVIPSAALVVRTKGPRVGVLDDQHRVHYRDVTTGRDFGGEIEVLEGLQVGATVVVHPGDDLPDGIVVEPVEPSKPGKPGNHGNNG